MKTKSKTVSENEVTSANDEVTSTKQKVKVALNWTANILCIFLIIFALIMAIFTIVRSTNDKKITKFGDNCYFHVMSDSMEPTISKKDVMIAKYYDGDGSDLKVGQIITFMYDYPINGKSYTVFNTHRIVEVVKNSVGVVTKVVTRGDNAKDEGKGIYNSDTHWTEAISDPARRGNTEEVYISNIVATWGDVNVDADGKYVYTSGKLLKGVGAFSNWIQDPVSGKTRFFCIVVLPLILLFVIYAFILVRTLIIAKIESNKQVAGENAVTLDSLSDAEKQRLFEEFAAKQKQDGEGTPNEAADGSQNEEANPDALSDETAGDGSAASDGEVAPDLGSSDGSSES